MRYHMVLVLAGDIVANQMLASGREAQEVSVWLDRWGHLIRGIDEVKPGGGYTHAWSLAQAMRDVCFDRKETADEDPF